MNLCENYEYAKKTGRAGAFMKAYGNALLAGKSEEDALRLARMKMTTTNPSLSASSKTLYRLYYRRAIEAGASENSARKDALAAVAQARGGE